MFCDQGPYKDRTIWGENSVLIKLRTLNKLFDGQMSGTSIFCSGTCCDCGRAVVIQIDKVAGGYGFKGGAPHEIGKWQFVIRCESCHRTTSKPDDVGTSGQTPVDASVADVSFFSKLGTL
jgi:hypothetical protein